MRNTLYLKRVALSATGWLIGGGICYYLNISPWISAAAFGGSLLVALKDLNAVASSIMENGQKLEELTNDETLDCQQIQTNINAFANQAGITPPNVIVAAFGHLSAISKLRTLRSDHIISIHPQTIMHLKNKSLGYLPLSALIAHEMHHLKPVDSTFPFITPSPDWLQKCIHLHCGVNILWFLLGYHDWPGILSIIGNFALLGTVEFIGSNVLLWLAMRSCRISEHCADLFSAEITGLPESVIQAQHYLEFNPLYTAPKLAGWSKFLDEQFSTHPTCDDRIKLLENYIEQISADDKEDDDFQPDEEDPNEDDHYLKLPKGEYKSLLRQFSRTVFPASESGGVPRIVSPVNPDEIRGFKPRTTRSGATY